MSQISFYSLDEKESSINIFTDRVIGLTEIILEEEAKSGLSMTASSLYRIYQLNLKQIAEESNSIVMVVDLNSDMYFYYDPYNTEVKSIKLDPSIVASVYTQTFENGLSDLGGVFESPYYVNSGVAHNTYDNIGAMVLIATPAHEYFELIFDLSQILLITIITMMIIALFVNILITQKLSTPLKNISSISKRYATGDFSLRIDDDLSCLEITELTDSLNDMAESISAGEKQRTVFIENVSHELKTPMTSIGGFVDGILDGTIPYESQDKYLRIVSDEVKRLSNLTVRMLKSSRIADDKFKITKAPFNFTDLIIKIVISFERQINAKNLDVSIDMPDNLFAEGDRDNVYQAVYILVDNAIKFIDEGGSFKIKLKEQGENAVFEISNTGETIPKEKLSNIFNRFYKVDASRTEDTTGAGLGLYLAKKIITMHGGELSVKSENGVTQFTFNLQIDKDVTQIN